MGWVDASSANILVRSAAGSPISLSYWPNSTSVTSSIALGLPSVHTDFTLSAHLPNLHPNTLYLYNTTVGLEGSFVTRRESHKMSKFTLLSTSCQKPNWPYNPLQHPLAINGWAHVEKVAAGMSLRPEAMLFLGDFIYSDLPYAVAEYTSSYYRLLYRQIYASPSWSPFLRSIPWLHMFDDHEIINDYAPSPALSNVFEEAIEPFLHYQQSVNPPPLVPSQPTYFSFDLGNVTFFILDCRSWRSPQPHRRGDNSTAGYGARTMLGERQLLEVGKWVERGREKDMLLVLVSGVPMTRNWALGRDEMDSWGGYLEEREEILEMLWSSGGAVVISGDRHEHATTLLPPPASSNHPYSSSVIEFSTSPLSFFHQPWTREYIPHPPTDITIYH
ncbi:hypothetical protein I350_01844 [Cryptococcus amylolentus CBS 6273]|uniref:PhoD-like phosphatase metallophosphatase domain-containing protein n=1 Tax=Cryptococcus amylolentus CBS 6273 TaxID=1296118 RepID=A0A1E3K9V9_9TREE|nr:hypothetical protein I350_01844 [Cryptococcus amylolentus CBS 6273]